MLRAALELTHQRLDRIEKASALGTAGTFDRLQFENALLTDSTALLPVLLSEGQQRARCCAAPGEKGQIRPTADCLPLDIEPTELHLKLVSRGSACPCTCHTTKHSSQKADPARRLTVHLVQVVLPSKICDVLR